MPELLIIKDRARSGVTLIEILIVTVIISLMAALAFPTWKIVQQREKERRLKKILNDVRAAIAGSKSQLSTTNFNEGIRTYIRVKGIELIKQAHNPATEGAIASAAIASFAFNLANTGLGYPLTPSHLTINSPYWITVATGPTDVSGNTGAVNIEINRRFLRTIPPHPFQSWYPIATWTFQPSLPRGSARVASASWGSRIGVIDIKSQGAGTALDGSNTDAW